MPAVFHLDRAGKRPLSVRLENDATVGRGRTAGLRIDSRLVSRNHCRVSVADDAVTVRDLDSRNGTRVDGEEVGPDDVPVPVGATLSVGGVELRLVRCGRETAGKLLRRAARPLPVPPVGAVDGFVPDVEPSGAPAAAPAPPQQVADADSVNPLSVLPGGDARDQSSFTGFGTPDDAVDSGLLDFLGGAR